MKVFWLFLLLAAIILLGLVFVFARMAARWFCKDPRSRTAGILGGLLGACIFAIGAIPLASAMDWLDLRGIDNAGVYLLIWALYGLALGLPIGLLAGVFTGLAVWKAATGGRMAVTGLLLGMAAGGAWSGPIVFLVPQRYFEHLDGVAHC